MAPSYCSFQAAPALRAPTLHHLVGRLNAPTRQLLWVRDCARLQGAPETRSPRPGGSCRATRCAAAPSACRCPRHTPHPRSSRWSLQRAGVPDQCSNPLQPPCDDDTTSAIVMLVSAVVPTPGSHTDAFRREDRAGQLDNRVLACQCQLPMAGRPVTALGTMTAGTICTKFEIRCDRCFRRLHHNYC